MRVKYLSNRQAGPSLVDVRLDSQRWALGFLSCPSEPFLYQGRRCELLSSVLLMQACCLVRLHYFYRVVLRSSVPVFLVFLQDKNGCHVL